MVEVERETYNTLKQYFFILRHQRLRMPHVGVSYFSAYSWIREFFTEGKCTLLNLSSKWTTQFVRLLLVEGLRELQKFLSSSGLTTDRSETLQLQ